MFDFDAVNESQREAITYTEGPVLIIAGPGTGKTFTLVKRISHLIHDKNVKPEEIMVVTFTEKSAKELLTRISNEFADESININNMYIGTFHSICLRLIDEYFEDEEANTDYRVLSNFEQVYIVCRNIEKFNLLANYSRNIRPAKAWDQAVEICRYVNQAMEELADTDAMENDRDADMKFLSRLVKRYKDLLVQNSAMDFSSIQCILYDLLNENADVLDQLREKIKYIMVDEYQDTNYIQEQLLFMIMGERKNICVVGDDDQSLYRFRGATVRNILEFPHKFDEGVCHIIHLDINYRSVPDIVSFNNRWMQGDDYTSIFRWGRYRYDKEIVSGKENATEESSVFCCKEGKTDTKVQILSFIKKLMADGNIDDYNQVAILFNSVKSTEAIELGRYLEANSVPVYSPRSDMFFERQEVKQILGCIMLCFVSYVSDLKTMSFVHVITQNLRQYYIECIKAAKELYSSDAKLQDYIRSKGAFVSSLDNESDTGLMDIFYELISFEPFSTYVQADIKGNVLGSRAARNIAEISKIISQFSFVHNLYSLNAENKRIIPEEFFNIFLKYMYEDGVSEYEDDAEYAPSGCISFMTIHQAKGLEFPVVIVGSLGNSPRKNNDPLLYSAECSYFRRKPFEPLNDIKYFDFWRLYYTAFTRAQDILVLCSVKPENEYFRKSLDILPDISEFRSDRVFEKVKEIKYKRLYSFTSHLSVYEGCPTQYKFYKEYGFVQNRMFHTSVGSLIHATLENLNRCAIAGQYDKINADNIAKWFDSNYNNMRLKTGFSLTEEQKKNAISQVQNYYNRRKDHITRVWKAEEEINLVFSEYILQGIVDLIEEDGECVEIIDYKTGPMPYFRSSSEVLEHYRRQLEIYAFLVEKQFGRKVSRMSLYYTNAETDEPVITFERNKNSIDDNISHITETIHKIEDKQFDDKAKNNYACIYCDMKYLCKKASIPKGEE